MKWILILVLLGTDGTTSQSVEFDHEQACLLAGDKLALELKKRKMPGYLGEATADRFVTWICTPKGMATVYAEEEKPANDR